MIFLTEQCPSALRPTPKLEEHVPIFMSPSDRVTSYTPRHRVPFASHSTTRRDAMEVFQLASSSQNKSYVIVPFCVTCALGRGGSLPSHPLLCEKNHLWSHLPSGTATLHSYHVLNTFRRHQRKGLYMFPFRIPTVCGTDSVCGHFRPWDSFLLIIQMEICQYFI
jgi:hypothetical protein